MEDIEKFFTEVKKKKREEKEKVEHDKKEKEESAKQSINNSLVEHKDQGPPRKLHQQVDKKCSAVFKSITREHREKI